jgi:lactoylglutathione lyase
MTARLNLTVLRSADIEVSSQFYRLLGLEFDKHSHGNGPEHYASDNDNFVFEIYPATAKFPPTVSTRIGFEVDDCDDVVTLLTSAGHSLSTMPSDSPWGRRAVATDPDGHKVEITSRRRTQEAEQVGSSNGG